MSTQIRSSAEYNRRAAIIEGLRAGRSKTEIIRFFGFPRSTVYDVAAKYLASEASEKGSANPTRKSHSKEKSVRTPAIIERAQELISEDPGLSLRKLAKILGVSETTIRRIAEEDLHFKSYVIKVRQTLSEAAKVNRVARCNLLLCSLKNEAAGRITFFSDEKIFSVDAKVNRKNDHLFARDPEDVSTARTKFPTSVHVLSVVSSEGHVMLPHFFQKEETVTEKIYLRILTRVVKPWIDTVAAGRPYVFQQDGTPAHTSHLVQNWLSDNMEMFWSKEFWPANSPDLNPMDYYVWGVVERVINKLRHPNVTSLQTAIKAAFVNMDKDALQRACQRFITRIETVIETKGDYIE